MTQPRAKRMGWAESPPADWAEREAHRIAGEIRRLRGSRSAQWLSDRTKELGYEVTRAVISDLENGRRRHVTTAELAILAVALSAAPISLIYPGPYDAQVDVVPGQPLAELAATEWFSGKIQLSMDSFEAARTSTLTLARRVEYLESSLERELAVENPSEAQMEYTKETRRFLSEAKAQLKAAYADREAALRDSPLDPTARNVDNRDA
ncbi:hypothetical protein [Mycobacteroides chelonae]|uniref:hypothetical protein n=1 Tax=Mycobacteroides chelonae TaxID=1774 RepID=UPI0011175924